MLDAFSPGGFTVLGVGCFNDAHIVATHPSLTGITDATLSNWSCSVHEAFDKWPVDFQVLAIARNIGSSFTATDGTVGTPYILARGVTVISDIKLTPLDDENPVGTSHTVTATVTTDTPSAGTPVVGTTVTFSVIGGPNTGASGTGVTDSSGVATFTYTSNGTEGADFIKATFADSAGRTQTSNTVTKKWVSVANHPPVAKCKNVIVSAGASCMAAASIDDGSFDPDGDSITVSQSPPGPYPLGTTHVTLTVTDSKGAFSACAADVTVVDTQMPVISCPAGTTAIAGDNCMAAVPNVLPGVAASDNCDNSLTLSQNPPAGALLGLGTHIITVTATDDAGNSSSCATTFTVANDAPVITSVTGPSGPLALGGSATVTANFTDTGAQAHAVTYSWDDGSSDTTVSLAPGVSTGAAAHVYSGAGVYTVKVTVTDVCGASATSIYEFIVVYDPDAGFVTGGGWINSPAGAYTADPSLTGKANFGFVSKYQRGASVPTGETEFQFKAGDLNFHSSSYQWLVVAGCKAQYKGTGTINGEPGYEFLLTAYDAQAGSGESCGGQSVDRFRIKIKGPGGVVYDNNPGGSGDIDGANPQAISGGSIVVHNR